MNSPIIRSADPAPSSTPRRSLFLPLVVTTLVLLAITAIYISYFLAGSTPALTLLWITLLSLGLTATVAYVLWRQMQRDYAEPLAQLAQSIENVASGYSDMPVWGIERADPVGAAARAAEKARRHWACLPDVILDTPNGPLPLRFNGESAALFSQLRNQIEGAVGNISKTAQQMQAGVDANQAGVRGFAEQLHLTLQHLSHSADESARHIAQLYEDVRQNATQLQMTHETAVLQITRVLPQLEQRSEGLNEIVRLTGQQAATTLQQLQQSSNMIRDAAQQNQAIGQRFSGEADDLSQRLFAAVNLLRSSGKVLADTNETARTRMHEILMTMTQAETALNQTLDSTRSRISLTADMADMLADLSQRTENNASLMANAVDGLLQHNANLSEQVDVSGRRLEDMLANVDSLQQKFANAVSTVAARSEQIEHVLRHLHGQHELLMSELARSGGDSASSLGRLATESEQLIARIEAQLALAGAIADTELRRLGDATAAAAENAQIASNQLTQATQMLLEGGSKVESVAGGMAGQLERLDREIGNSIESVVSRTDRLAAHNEERLDAVYNKVDDIAQRLNALGQLTNTMSHVASQLAQLIPQLGNGTAEADVAELRQDMYSVVKDLLEWQKSINATLRNLPIHLQQELGENLDRNLLLLRGQMEATRQDMMAAVTEEQHGFGRKLSALEEVTGFVADNVTAPKPDAGQLAAALRGIVTALSQINGQLHDFDARLPALASYPVAEGGQKVDQALDAVTDIFSSLRDRGDDVINRLNDMARHLQTAADKIHKEG
ncbi:MAG: hypothetical protein KBA75_03665 [Alphaproteobacteria bacterium]|nr:hypothetical protein [Alphaproteobacteria bacterium]